MSSNFVFIHGGGQASWVWEDAIAALKAQVDGDAQVLALDVPGCGAKRGRDVSAMPFTAIAPELIDEIRTSGLNDIVLVGHSQSGTIVPDIARACADRVKRVIYVSCMAMAPGFDVIGYTTVHMHGEAQTELGDLIRDENSSAEARFRAMFCNDMAPDEADAFMARLGQDSWPDDSYAHREWSETYPVPMPVSYVLCQRDTILPPEWQRRFAEAFGAERIVEIDAGHQPMNTRPQELAAILLAEAAR